MKKLSKLGLILGLTMIMSLAVASLAFAVGVRDTVYTMPGVPQLVGIPDKPYAEFTIEECRGCHLDPGELTTADLHHNSTTALTQGCVGCHPVDYTNNSIKTGAGFDRTCTSCHSSSWHHTNPRAAGGQCAFCHDSSLIGNVGDGWKAPELPTYDITDATPRPIDCNNCHIEFRPDWAGPDPNTFNSPNGTSHHGTDLQTCSFCHGAETETAFTTIRLCEGCHTITSLHTIKGHVEAASPTNESGRCLGCHGAYMYNLPETNPLPPSITALDKSTVMPLQYLTLYGENFGTKVDGIKAELVRYSSTGLASRYPAPVVNVTPTEMQIMIPTVPSLGNYDVILENAGGRIGTGKTVSVTKKPVVTTLSATAGKAGDTLLIDGLYFNTNGTPKVKMAKYNDPAPLTLNPTFVGTKLQVTIPVSASGTYNISVINDNGESNLVTYTVGVAPKINSLYPTSTQIGKAVNIYGSSLMIGKTKPIVKFGNTAVTQFGTCSATQVTVYVPAGLAKGATNVTVTTSFGTSNAKVFTVK